MESDRSVILIVEDDATTREVLTELFATEGYSVACAADGATAVERAQVGDVDLVLLDLGLPDLSGLELCQRLRAEPRSDYLPIIMFTGQSSKADRHSGFQAGADDFVPKLCDVEEL